MARTIDNLGVDSSTRYAEDRELFDESLIKEARTIPSQTKISVTIPSYKAEFDLLFDTKKEQAPWAAFIAPPNYYASRRRLFSEQLIPQLGHPEMQEAQLARIDRIRQEEQDKGSSSGDSEVEKEGAALSKLFENIHIFDQLLIDINSRRSQYQKG